MLVDTSVWVDHFRRGNRDLTALLNGGEVECHPFIIGELACGSLHRRDEVLFLLQNLPGVPAGSHKEVLAFVESHRLMGRGIGWIDAQLLVSASLARVRLWTHDRRLSAVARSLNLHAQP
jgi:predicted nucleic acid-binding protein